MRKPLALVSGCGLLAIALTFGSQAAGQADFRTQFRGVTGTFSSIAYNRESGDAHGYEIRILPSDAGLKALVQINEGHFGDVYFVPSTQTAANKVTMSIEYEPKKMVEIVGTVSKEGLAAEFNWKSGKEQVFLKRGGSYWDGK